MAKRDQASILVRMPATLKRRLGREVARSERTLNDIAGEILADEYGVPFRPSGRKGSAPGESGDVLLRIPHELKRRLDDSARDRSISTNKLVVDLLAERLGGSVP